MVSMREMLDMPAKEIEVPGMGKVGIYHVSNKDQLELAKFPASDKDMEANLKRLVKLVFFSLRKGTPDITEEMLWEMSFDAGAGKMILDAILEVMSPSFRPTVGGVVERKRRGRKSAGAAGPLPGADDAREPESESDRGTYVKAD